MSNLTRKIAELSPEKRNRLLQKLKKEKNWQVHSKISPVDRSSGKFLLSYAQERLWFLEQLDPGTSVYNVPYNFRFDGPFNVDALKKALQTVIKRHDILRTTFRAVEGQPVQAVSAEPLSELVFLDISDLSTADLEDTVIRLVDEEAQKPFDIQTGPLFRATLVRLHEEVHGLLLTMHHIISDGSSLEILVHELIVLYEAFAHDKPHQLPELQIQYVDYAAWQRNCLQGDVLEKLLSYWKPQLSGAPATLELPTDRPRPAVQTFSGAYEIFRLAPGLSDKIKALAKESGATPFMTVLTVFKILLQRYTGQIDIVVGTPVAGRTRSETEGLIGCFINNLVLRSDLSGNPSFRQLLTRVKQVSLAAYSHQDLPFEQLVEEVQPERNLSASPLFQVMFIMLNAPNKAIELTDIVLTPLLNNTMTSKFDLTLYLDEGIDNLVGTFEYNTDLFDASTIALMANHFSTLLESIVENPDQKIDVLAILTTEEKQRILLDRNDTSHAFSSPECFHRQFEAQASKSPEAVAVVFTEKQLTYCELNARANQLANHLVERGVKPGVLVGLYIERSLDMFVGLLGIMKAGGAYVPLDPSFPKDRIAYMLDDAGAPLLITQAALLAELPEFNGQVVCIDRDWPEISKASSAAPTDRVSAETLAYVIYTSGSTGRPKGVAIAHKALGNFLNTMRDKPGISEKDVLLAVTTLSFDIAALELYLPLTVGATVVLASKEVTADGRRLAALLTQSNATIMQATPATWRMLLEFGWQAKNNLTILAGGEALPRELANQLLERGACLWNMYGPTETTIWSLIDQVEIDEGAVFIGAPIANTRIYVLDRYLQPVPEGVYGELYIGGHGLARGYLNRAELTAERFIPDPFGTVAGDRLYRTGDLVRLLANGNIEFAGRIDNQVKIRGFRIELGEIEAVLTQHPTIRSAVVTPKEMAPGDVRLVAYVIYDSHTQPSISELRGFLRETLPDYMVPSIFVTLDAYPMTPNGKVDRKNLPLPSGERAVSATKFIAPNSATEKFLATTWEKILGVDQVGVHDSFFELGGHSLLSMKVIYRIEEEFGVRINPREVIFNNLRQLAQLTDEQAGSDTLSEKIEKVSRDTSSFPLSYTQERLWYLEQLDPGTAVYNIPYNIRFDGPLNQTALTNALNAIVQRHEALRTSFAAEEGRPVQIVSDQVELDVPVIDLSHLPESEFDRKIAILINEEAHKPFDIRRSPLFRATILRLNDKVHGLLLNMHHIVVDGQSLEILIEELTTLYQAYAQDKPAQLADLPIQYIDFAAWQKQWSNEEALERLLAYWRSKLAAIPSTLELPTDHPRPPVQTFPGATLSLTIPAPLTSSLQKLSKSENATLFMTLLAVFKALLCRYTGQEDIVVGTPVSGRNRFETERLIGCFINNLVLRTDAGNNPTFRELLARVKQTALDAYSHQDLPFEQLVDAIQPERNLSVSPLFQVMFIFLNAPNQAVALSEMTMTPLLHATKTSKYDLTLYVSEGKETLCATFEYNTDLFDAATLERMSSHLQTLLEKIVANPDQRLGDLPLLTTAEQQDLLFARNDTARDFNGQDCFVQTFEAQVKRSPDSIAVEFEGEELTYEQLNARANQLAWYLQSVGVGPDVLVGLCVERSLDLLVGPLAIMKAGGAYVPLDPSFPRERRAFMLEDAGVSVLLTQEQLLAELPENKAQIVCLDRDRELFARESSNNPTNKLSPANLAYVIYTSGSTGKPKGVAIEHRTLANFLSTMGDEPGLTENDVLLAVTTLSFDIAALELYLPLTVGAQVKLASRDEASDGRRLNEALTQGNATVMQATPATWRMLLDFGWSGNQQLKILAGGEALPFDLARELLRKGAALWNMYGPTETTIWSMLHQVATDDDFISIGHPIANTQIYLLDRNQQPVPDGVFGELYIAGDGLARGYLNRSEMTAEKFVPDPFSSKPGARMYRTGDLVRYRSDSSIEFSGRIDHQVKIRGFRIELGEIEAVLAQHETVREVTVTPKEMAQGDVRLVAYVIYDSFNEPTISELRKFLKERLPDYMVPSIFVSMEAFPLTPNGKVDRKNLPVPAGMRAEMSEAFEAPDSEMEKYLAAVWEEILGMKGVSVNDNFFDLGGHSLLSMKVIYQIEKEYGLYVNPREVIFRNLRQLAQFCDEQMSAGQGAPSNGLTRRFLNRLKNKKARA